MSADRRLTWHGEELQISTKQNGDLTINPTPNYHDTVTTPRTAEIIVRPTSPGWNQHRGTTYFLEQVPPVEVCGPRTGKGNYTYTSRLLLGRSAYIYSDEQFWPPELPDILNYLHQQGWEMNNRIFSGIRQKHTNS